MRILIYSYNYHPEPIGIAPLMTELAEGLLAKGHQVRVSTAMPWYPESQIYKEYRGKLYTSEELNGIKLNRCYVWSRPERNLRNRVLFELSFVFLSFWQCLKGWRPDIIFLTVPGLPVCIPAVLLSKIYHRPLVLNLQDILPEAAVNVGLLKNPQMIWVMTRLEEFAYRHAHKITVITSSFRDNLLKKGVNSQKIVEISNWVDTEFIKPLERDKSSFRLKYNLEDKFVVLYSGNIALTQGLETLIEAASYLQNRSQIAIVVVGENKAIAQLEAFCQKKQVKNVQFLPFQPRKMLPDMLAGADVGIVMQKKNVVNFNMPSKIQVLLASGCPIIASVPAIGTAAQAIRNSGGGIIVSPENPKALAEAIVDMYEHPAQLEIFSQKGREYAEKNYAFDAALDKYEQLFESLISKSQN